MRDKTGTRRRRSAAALAVGITIAVAGPHLAAAVDGPKAGGAKAGVVKAGAVKTGVVKSGAVKTGAVRVDAPVQSCTTTGATLRCDVRANAAGPVRVRIAYRADATRRGTVRLNGARVAGITWTRSSAGTASLSLPVRAGVNRLVADIADVRIVAVSGELRVTEGSAIPGFVPLTPADATGSGAAGSSGSSTSGVPTASDPSATVPAGTSASPASPAANVPPVVLAAAPEAPADVTAGAPATTTATTASTAAATAATSPAGDAATDAAPAAPTAIVVYEVTAPREPVATVPIDSVPVRPAAPATVTPFEIETCALSGPARVVGVDGASGKAVFGDGPSVSAQASCSLTVEAAGPATLDLRYQSAGNYDRQVTVNGVRQTVRFAATGRAWALRSLPVTLAKGVNTVILDLSYVWFDQVAVQDAVTVPVVTTAPPTTAAPPTTTPPTTTTTTTTTTTRPPSTTTTTASPTTTRPTVTTTTTTTRPTATTTRPTTTTTTTRPTTTTTRPTTTTTRPTTTTTTTTTRPPTTTTLPPTGGSVLDVRSEGAKGDGVTDDTAAIQRASNKVKARGGGTVYFPSGVYKLSFGIHIYPGITYEGTGASIIRAVPNYPKDTRLFTTESFPWAGAGDSPLLVIRGLIFDGQSSLQGAYKDYQNEHAHQLYLTGSPSQPGRLRALVENSTFRNGVADGISITSNADVTIRNVRGENLFRGAVVMTGGFSKLLVDGLTTVGNVDRTGIDIETDTPGWGGTFRNDSVWRNVTIDGDLDFGVSHGSTVYAENLTMRSGPIFMTSKDTSSIRIVNSTLAVGMSDSYLNRIVAPGKVQFDNVTFVMTNQGAGPYYGISIYWQLMPTTQAQSVTCNVCRFTTDGTTKPGVPIYGFISRFRGPNDTLTLSSTTFSPAFTAGVYNVG